MSEENRVDIADPFAKRLMARYLGRREADLEVLRGLLEGSDFDSIRIKGHNLYGSGSAYGLDPISELGELLEEAAASQDRALIGDLIERLDRYIRNLRIV